MTKRKHVKAPLTYNPGNGQPKEHLAYLNYREMEALRRLNGEGPYKGPKGLPSFVLGGATSSGTAAGATMKSAQQSSSGTSSSKNTGPSGGMMGGAGSGGSARTAPSSAAGSGSGAKPSGGFSQSQFGGGPGVGAGGGARPSAGGGAGARPSVGGTGASISGAGGAAAARISGGIVGGNAKDMAARAIATAKDAVKVASENASYKNDAVKGGFSQTVFGGIPGGQIKGAIQAVKTTQPRDTLGPIPASVSPEQYGWSATGPSKLAAHQGMGIYAGNLVAQGQELTQKQIDTLLSVNTSYDPALRNALMNLPASARTSAAALASAAALSGKISPRAAIEMGAQESELGQLPNTPGSSYYGLTQMGKPEFKTFATPQSAKLGINDPWASAQAGVSYMAQNADRFTKEFNRVPTSGDMYGMHQQGYAGYTGLLKNPSTPAYKKVGLDAVMSNLPKNLRNRDYAMSVTGSQFAKIISGQPQQKLSTILGSSVGDVNVAANVPKPTAKPPGLGIGPDPFMVAKTPVAFATTAPKTLKSIDDRLVTFRNPDGSLVTTSASDYADMLGRAGVPKQSVDEVYKQLVNEPSADGKSNIRNVPVNIYATSSGVSVAPPRSTVDMPPTAQLGVDKLAAQQYAMRMAAALPKTSLPATPRPAIDQANLPQVGADRLAAQQYAMRMAAGLPKTSFPTPQRPATERAELPQVGADRLAAQQYAARMAAAMSAPIVSAPISTPSVPLTSMGTFTGAPIKTPQMANMPPAPVPARPEIDMPPKAQPGVDVLEAAAKAARKAETVKETKYEINIPGLGLDKESISQITQVLKDPEKIFDIAKVGNWSAKNDKKSLAKVRDGLKELQEAGAKINKDGTISIPAAATKLAQRVYNDLAVAYDKRASAPYATGKSKYSETFKGGLGKVSQKTTTTRKDIDRYRQAALDYLGAAARAGKIPSTPSSSSTAAKLSGTGYGKFDAGPALAAAADLKAGQQTSALQQAKDTVSGILSGFGDLIKAQPAGAQQKIAEVPSIGYGTFNPPTLPERQGPVQPSVNLGYGDFTTPSLGQNFGTDSFKNFAGDYSISTEDGRFSDFDPNSRLPGFAGSVDISIKNPKTGVSTPVEAALQNPSTITISNPKEAITTARRAGNPTFDAYRNVIAGAVPSGTSVASTPSGTYWTGTGLTNEQQDIVDSEVAKGKTAVNVFTRGTLGKVYEKVTKEKIDKYAKATVTEKRQMELADPSLIGWAMRLGMQPVNDPSLYKQWAESRGLRGTGAGKNGGGIYDIVTGISPKRGGYGVAAPRASDSSASTPTAAGRPEIYYSWDLGINIPSPNDPLYTMYMTYLAERQAAQRAMYA